MNKVEDNFQRKSAAWPEHVRLMDHGFIHLCNKVRDQSRWMPNTDTHVMLLLLLWNQQRLVLVALMG